MLNLKPTLFRRRILEDGNHGLWEEVLDPNANQIAGWEYRYFLG